jgi:hypothetical protein
MPCCCRNESSDLKPLKMIVIFLAAVAALFAFRIFFPEVRRYLRSKAM